MSYRVCRGSGIELAGGAATLEVARGLIAYDMSRHREMIAAPFGGTPGIEWAWNADVLEARNDATGAVLYTIRAIPDP